MFIFPEDFFGNIVAYEKDQIIQKSWNMPPYSPSILWPRRDFEEGAEKYLDKIIRQGDTKIFLLDCDIYQKKI